MFIYQNTHQYSDVNKIRVGEFTNIKFNFGKEVSLKP